MSKPREFWILKGQLRSSNNSKDAQEKIRKDIELGPDHEIIHVREVVPIDEFNEKTALLAAKVDLKSITAYAKAKDQFEEITRKLIIAKSALNRIGMLQMGELDYTKDFFELTKQIVRETLQEIDNERHLDSNSAD